MIRTVEWVDLPTDTREAASTGLVGDTGPFGAVWGQSPAILRQADMVRWLPTVADLLETPLLVPPFISLTVGGKALPADRYCHQERVVMYTKVQQRLDRDLVEAEVKAGAAIKFNRLELWNAPVAAVARAIERARGRRVKVWGFLSPQGEQMVPAHRDPAHVLALQLDGSKRWRLDGPRPDSSWSGLAPLVATGEPLTDVLEAGDALYLPYGYAHSAAAETGMSYHIAFAIEGTTAGELRTQVVKLLYDRLDRGDATEIAPSNVATVLDEVRAALGGLSEELAMQGRELAALDSRGLQAAIDRLFPTDDRPTP